MFVKCAKIIGKFSQGLFDTLTNYSTKLKRTSLRSLKVSCVCRV